MPALCMPEFDNQGNCTGMCVHLPGDNWNITQVEWQIPGNETTIVQSFSTQASCGCAISFDKKIPADLKKKAFWSKQRTIESWLQEMRDGGWHLHIVISVGDDE